MKYFAALLLLAPSLVAAAVAHWVQIGDSVGISNGANTPNIQTQVYIDDANIIDETDGFKGYTIRFVLPAPVETETDAKAKISYQIVETILEYNCSTGIGRGKRTKFTSMEGVTTATSTDGWREIPAGSGASAMMNAVKTRACH